MGNCRSRGCCKSNDNDDSAGEADVYIDMTIHSGKGKTLKDKQIITLGPLPDSLVSQLLCPSILLSIDRCIYVFI